MASRCFSGLVLFVVMIILFALECSIAKFDQGNCIESQKEVLLQSDIKFLLGRKMLQELDAKPVYIPGKSKPADLYNSFPEIQTENNQVQTQAKRGDSTGKKHDESKTFLEAAEEVANLMRKDYRGMARRKPPINNHEPKD